MFMNKLKKYENMPDKEWADLVMLWFKDNPEMMVSDDGKELYQWAKKTCSDWQFHEPDIDVEATRRKLDEYDNFRDKVMKLIYSEKLALPNWLMDINELIVHMNYAFDPDKKLDAIKAFEKRMYQEFLKYKQNPDDVRWR